MLTVPAPQWGLLDLFLKTVDCTNYKLNRQFEMICVCPLKIRATFSDNSAAHTHVQAQTFEQLYPVVRNSLTVENVGPLSAYFVHFLPKLWPRRLNIVGTGDENEY